jgi:hypothetical protein
MTAEMFDRVIDICVTKAKVGMEPDSKEKLRALCLSRDAIGLRANYPWDFCKMILSISEYEESAPVLDSRLMAKAAELYWGAIDSKMDARRVVGAPGAAPRPAPVAVPPAAEADAVQPVEQPAAQQPVAQQPVAQQPVVSQVVQQPAPIQQPASVRQPPPVQHPAPPAPTEFVVQPPAVPAGFDLHPGPAPQFAVAAMPSAVAPSMVQAAPAPLPGPSAFPRPSMPTPGPPQHSAHAQMPQGSAEPPLGRPPVRSTVAPPGAAGGLPARVPIHGGPTAPPVSDGDPDLLAALRSAAAAGDRELYERETVERR